MEPVHIEISPAQWLPERSQWDKAGPFYDGDPVVAEGATHTHAWAANHGAYAYAFAWPAPARGNVEISARLSSEHPWYSSPQNHFSDVTLRVNGSASPGRRIIPDDGSGRIYTWSITPEAVRVGNNVLEFAVRRNALYRNGLCIYFKAVVPDAEDCPITIAGHV